MDNERYEDIYIHERSEQIMQGLHACVIHKWTSWKKRSDKWTRGNGTQTLPYLNSNIRFWPTQGSAHVHVGNRFKSYWKKELLLTILFMCMSGIYPPAWYTHFFPATPSCNYTFVGFLLKDIMMHHCPFKRKIAYSQVLLDGARWSKVQGNFGRDFFSKGSEKKLWFSRFHANFG